MGTGRSIVENTHSITSSDDPFWNPQSATNRNMNNEAESSTSPQPSDNDREEHRQQLQRNLHEFKQELQRKHEKRRQLIVEKRREFQLVKDELEKLKEENAELKLKVPEKHQETSASVNPAHFAQEIKELKEDNEELRLQVEKLKIHLKAGEEVNEKNKELRITVSEMQLDLQKLNSEMLNIEQERLEYSKHISALKDVVKVTKDMLAIRDSQIQGLKVKVESVEELLASKEMKIMSDGLREEYEKQLRNIRNLRTLYEERQRLDKIDKEHLQVQLEEAKKQVENEQKISSDRLERIEELETDSSAKYDEITNLRSSLGLTKAECTELQAEIDVINQLFSQILLGFNNSPEIDFDKLRHILEENHGLLTDIASNEESHSTAAALPKVLLDLINQINNENDPKDEQSVASALHQLNSPAEIVENLPKVWKVLIELLSHQNPPLSALKEGEKDPCYKSVETPTGPKLKLSVSQTFIRLKDLIIEKKFLEREMYRLKHLNTHLEGRLQDQEKRLELVSGELTITWHVVEKMQRQHQQLHTHEKVLRYELHEKRKLLTELKEELQYCRDKWVQARAKNDTTQEQWKELRKEFAARKTADDFNQSAESGYSDDKDSSEEDEKGYESDVSDLKRESDCDDSDNAPSAAIQATCLVQVDEMKENDDENNEAEKGFKDCALNADVVNSLILTETAVACPESAFTDLVTAENVQFHLNAKNLDLPELSSSDANVVSVDVANSSSSTLHSESVNCSTGAIKKTSIAKLRGTNQKTNEERLEIESEATPNLEKTDLQSAQSVDSRLEVKDDSASASASSSKQPELQTTTNDSNINVKPARTSEEMFAAREKRLKRLEEESTKLFKKVTNTKLRSTNISDKLDSLHEMYGQGSSNNAVKENSCDLTTEHLKVDNTDRKSDNVGNRLNDAEQKSDGSTSEDNNVTYENDECKSENVKQIADVSNHTSLDNDNNEET